MRYSLGRNDGESRLESSCRRSHPKFLGREAQAEEYKIGTENKKNPAFLSILDEKVDEFSILLCDAESSNLEGDLKEG